MQHNEYFHGFTVYNNTFVTLCEESPWSDKGEHANSTQKCPRIFLLLGKVANTSLLYSKTKLNPLCFLSEKMY